MDPQPELWPVERVCQLAGRFMALMDVFDTFTHYFDQRITEMGSDLDGAAG